MGGTAAVSGRDADHDEHHHGSQARRLPLPSVGSKHYDKTGTTILWLWEPLSPGLSAWKEQGVLPELPPRELPSDQADGGERVLAGTLFVFFFPSFFSSFFSFLFAFSFSLLFLYFIFIFISLGLPYFPSGAWGYPRANKEEYIAGHRHSTYWWGRGRVRVRVR